MSQIDNKVKWCLNKAEKELKEGRKHRGLVKIKPNIETAKRHFEKAEHNLRALNYFEKGGFADWSFSAGFYSIYHCFLAIIAKFSYESINQECTIALVEQLKESKKIELSKDIIEALKSEDSTDRVIVLREEFQYGFETNIKEKEKLQRLRKLCEKALDETKDIIYK